MYVGDDERDIVAGRAAGMRTVAATYGYMGEQAEVARWDADAAIASPMRALAIAANRPKIAVLGAALVSTWVRNRSGACRAECARKTDSNKLTANDERFALAA